MRAGKIRSLSGGVRALRAGAVALVLLTGTARAQFIEETPPPPPRPPASSPPAPAPTPPTPPAASSTPRGAAATTAPAAPPRMPLLPTAGGRVPGRAADEDDDPKPAARRVSPGAGPDRAGAPGNTLPMSPASPASKAEGATSGGAAAAVAGAKPMAGATAPGAKPGPAPRPEHLTPLIKLAYRRSELANLDASTLTLNTFEINMFAVSMKWLRVGTALELGSASGATKSGGSSTNVYVVSGGFVGFQYPWRLTPFVDFRANGGVIGGDAAGRFVMTWTWLVGIDVGTEIYLVDRAYISLAIGWSHPVYRGYDLAYSTMFPYREPRLIDITSDSFTFKIGIGL